MLCSTHYFCNIGVIGTLSSNTLTIDLLFVTQARYVYDLAVRLHNLKFKQGTSKYSIRLKIYLVQSTTELVPRRHENFIAMPRLRSAKGFHVPHSNTRRVVLRRS